jgi:protein ImuB
LAEARARAPDLIALADDPAGAASSLATLADWCGGYSPWTAIDGRDGIWLDLTGAVPLFPSEAALAADLLGRLRQRGFACRAAIADTPGAAWALARHGMGAEGADMMAVIAPPGGQRLALATLPVTALRLAPELVQELRRLGLRRIEQLYRLPRAPLAPRFGTIVAERLDQALGLIQEPISPRRPPAPRQVRQACAEPLISAEALTQATRNLIEALCRQLAAEGLGARRLSLSCYRVDCRVERVRIGTSRPSRDPAHLLRLIAPEIATIAPELGIELLRLEALEVERLGPEQLDLTGTPAVSDPRLAGDARLAPLIDRLANRLGADQVLRLAPVASHVPERACCAVPALAAPPLLGRWPETGRPRPLRLLMPPDPIEVMAPVPDDPPLTFRWHRILHRVVHAEGPERIAAEWWRDPAVTEDDIRDYYRVEDASGSRFWLYRRGFYRPEASPRWFLHGFFG